MPKVSSYGGFTPVLGDLLYGVDDPGGTPISDKMTITALMTLLDASSSTLTNKALGSGCSVSDPLETFESTGIDDNATSHALTIDSSERILTGATVPDALGAEAGSMTISTGNSGVTGINTSADELVIEGSGALVGLTIASANTASGVIYFADPEGSAVGRIVYDHSDNTIKFTTGGGGPRITLDSNTGTTAGSGSAGAGNQTVELTINGLRYNLLHDGTT